ncbi:MAG TPA: hypothetical protein DHV08_09330 [Rhodocyclaceae bacterium]|nr:MAG: hypothetical protein AUK49_03330 [Betaproteobacteria bacterium CG2_30_68_42]PIV73854.1 MAG: hypothetical protein COW56_05905 [Rhodocyclales bacterium CG17_big_fil_post_rev_8_21_14_2_50_68_7]HCX33736.1 hypothetical protein [Rhodocyclaceae bacterium]
MRGIAFRSAFVAACSLAIAVAAQGTEPKDGRVLYLLNCAGCHPLPDPLPPQFGGGELAGEFAQLPAGRVFFMRIPAAGPERLSAAENERLIAEVRNWRKHCPVIGSGTPWNGLRPPAR